MLRGGGFLGGEGGFGGWRGEAWVGVGHEGGTEVVLELAVFQTEGSGGLALILPSIERLNLPFTLFAGKGEEVELVAGIEVAVRSYSVEIGIFGFLARFGEFLGGGEGRWGGGGGHGRSGGDP